MTSHQLAIAKASFSAGLLRPDPTSLSRDSIAIFHTLLNTAILQCTPQNVQICKRWILENIVQSTARFTALGKYLTALSSSFEKTEGKKEPSVKRKRLHILYLVNDILHHAKYRSNDASVCGKVQPILVGLFELAAAFKTCPKHQRKIQDLLDIWEDKAYYSRDYIQKLREAVKTAVEGGHTEGTAASGEKDQGLAAKSSKNAPYVMPAMHGDASTPWFDLPAGNLMPHIIPNSTRPINPDMIRPLQFVAGPADENLVLAVKALLDDVKGIYGEENEEKASWDIDELGQPIIFDEITGEVIEGEGYYGWSRNFCEKMKRRKKGLGLPIRDEDRGRRSRSGSSSPDLRKRRRSDSQSSSREYRSRRRGDSYSSSRSRSPQRSTKNGHSRPPRSRSGSYSRSRSPPPPRTAFSRPPNPAFPPPPSQERLPPKPPIPNIPPPPFIPQQQQGYPPNFQPPPPPPPPQYGNLPFNPPQGPGSQPQYGAWPPPPPPQMGFNPNQAQQGQQQQTYNTWAPPPPPPPPGPPPAGPGYGYGGQQQYQQQQQAQGGYTPTGPGQGQGQQYPPSGPGGWQGNGRGFGGQGGNGGWNNGGAGGGYRGGRGGYRGGRGW